MVKRASGKWKAQMRRSHILRSLTDHCVVCYGGEPLVVHHLAYKQGGRGSNLELPEDVVVLCVTCHNLLHKRKMEGRAKFKLFRETRRNQLQDEFLVPAWLTDV